MSQFDDKVITLTFTDLLTAIAAMDEARAALADPIDLRRLLHAHTALHDAIEALEIAAEIVQTH